LCGSESPTSGRTIQPTNQPTNFLLNMAPHMSFGSFLTIWPFRIEDRLCQFDPDGHTFIICYFIMYISVVTDIIDLLILPSVLTHPRKTKVPNVNIRQSQFSSPDEILHRYLLRFIHFSMLNLYMNSFKVTLPSGNASF
jgi:hypothetical protein